MRLSRLDLKRYGHFTDRTIDFGAAEPGRPDLHVVYGPNEAGKSTALAAILDLLFGIEVRSRYNFLHPYPTMAIGAALEFGGSNRELVRVKRGQNTLLDAAGQPTDEGALAAALSNVGRDGYRDMFSMDDDTLEAGGEGILASKGDLGQLLFSASAGLAAFSDRLAEAQSEADAFLKARSRSGELATLKGRLAELKRQKDGLDTLAARHAQLVVARDTAKRGHDAALTARSAVQARSDAVRRQLEALPRLATLRVLREQARELGDGPEAPPSWADELADLKGHVIRTTTKLENSDARVAQLGEEVARLVVDEGAIACGGQVDRLDELRPRHVTAEKDLPERRAQLRDAETAIDYVLRRLGREGEADPSRLLLDASVGGVLRDLMEMRSGTDEALDTARSEEADARRLADAARGDVERASLGTHDDDRSRVEGIERVRDALAALDASEAETRRRLAGRSRASLAGELTDELGTLRPWVGDADELAQMPVPDASELERWRVELADAESRVARAGERIERAEADVRGHQARLDAAAAIAGLVPEQDVAAVRADRERAWVAHRSSLDEASAERFEVALRKDDAVTATRIGHEKDLATLRAAHEAIAVAAGTVRAAGAARETALRAAEAVRNDVAAAAAAMSPALRGLVLPRLETWLSRRESALDVRGRLNASEQDVHEADDEIAALRARLAAALSTAGPAQDPGADLDALAGVARSALAREAELGAMRARLSDRERDLARRRDDLGQAIAEEHGWQEAWDAACARCWLGGGDPRRTVSEVRGLMEAVADLGPLLERRAGLADRIGKMEADQSAFVGAVAAAAAEMPAIDASGSPNDLAKRLEEAVRQARAEKVRLSERTEDLRLVREERERLAEAAASHARRVGEMAAFVGAGSLDEVERRLRDLERRATLLLRAQEAEMDIVAALGSQTIADAEALLDGLDRQGLEAELAEARVRFEDQDQRTRDCYAALRAAEEQLEAIGGDDAVARIAEARRTTLLEVVDKALRHLRLRTGIAAAERALRLYRERHRSTMLGSASDAFRLMTRGRYTLASRPERDGEALIAVAATGGSKTAQDLSKGTRFQLYLALRVAGHQEFARSRTALPFIADDIMETFDPFRAERAFRALAGMAEVGQVVYLTHHPHLCRIAARVCPTVRIHALDPLPADP